MTTRIRITICIPFSRLHFHQLMRTARALTVYSQHVTSVRDVCTPGGGCLLWGVWHLLTNLQNIGGVCSGGSGIGGCLLTGGGVWTGGCLLPGKVNCLRGVICLTLGVSYFSTWGLVGGITACSEADTPMPHVITGVDSHLLKTLNLDTPMIFILAVNMDSMNYQLRKLLLAPNRCINTSPTKQCHVNNSMFVASGHYRNIYSCKLVKKIQIWNAKL